MHTTVFSSSSSSVELALVVDDEVSTNKSDGDGDEFACCCRAIVGVVNARHRNVCDQEERTIAIVTRSFIVATESE